MINLLPKPQQQQVAYELISHQLLRFWVWIVGSMLLLAVATMLAGVYLSGQTKSVQAGIDATRQQLASETNRQLQDEVQALTHEIGRLDAFRSEHYYWSEALVELGQIIPTDLVVDVLSLERSTGRISISGKAQTRQAMLDFWAAVHQSDYFTGINFPLANLEQAQAAPFTFEFDLNNRRIRRPQP